MKRLLTIVAIMHLHFALPAQRLLMMSKATLQDKIKGGWAGQTIGVTYGGPIEFRYNGTMVNAYQPIPWYEGYVKHTMINTPGLYDDLYMDLTFVDVMEKEGIDAPAASHARAYANAGYMLWHANQAGRYNILHGIAPPQSGHWLNNPHADDIDFQIEADFSGLMAPGMPNTAAEIGDPIGHIMNYGDGWYGGVLVGAMYSLAFVAKDINEVVTEALKTIPKESTFYQCIDDVVKWHRLYPDDWRKTWFELQKKWTDETGCPDGVFHAFDIDAKINAAYIVLGLLYGNGDFTKTLDVAVHAGQDADCNPSSAAGILGAFIGYDKIPDYWKTGLKDAEDIEFKYTTISLNKVYALGMKHALQVIARQGGKVGEKDVMILVQEPKVVRLEQGFTGLKPVEMRAVNQDLANEFLTEFSGTGFVLKGEARPKEGSSWDYTGAFAFKAELYLDGRLAETADLPVRYTQRRHELFWKYQLTAGKHAIRIKLINPDPGFVLHISEMLVYDSKP